MFRQAKWDEPLIFELSRAGGRVGYTLPKPIEDVEVEIPEKLRRKSPLDLPELSEPEVVRHYTRLSEMNYGVDSGIYRSAPAP